MHDNAGGRFVCLKVNLTEAAYCLLILREKRLVIKCQEYRYLIFLFNNIFDNNISSNQLRREKKVGKRWMLIVCSPTSSLASCFDNFLFSWLLFSLRSHSITRAHQGSITVQPKTKNPSVTSWHKRCKAIAKGDEKRQRIPCNLWLQPWNGSRHLETGNPHFALDGLIFFFPNK